VVEILGNINSLLYRSTAIQQFATFFLARVEGSSLRMTFSNAGHNYPMILRRGSPRILLDRGGTLLGILEQTTFEQADVALAPGDVVVLYTDGVSEAMNALEQQFGEERIAEVVESLPRDVSAREIAERLSHSLREFLDGVEPQDDITILVLRVLERAPAPARVDGEPAAVATR
jgi:sigma-B regulation protein RsbU (phosphoserine phosphatase)